MPPLFIAILLATSAFSARVHRFIGGCLRWLTLVMAAIVFVVVVTRTFDLGSIALQESLSYLHASVFMLCLGYASLNGAHVRVDILYRRYSPLAQAWVNLFGTLLFLLPFSVFIAAISFEPALKSWKLQEGSINAGGLPLVYLLRSLPFTGGLLLTLYGIGESARLLLEISVVRQEQAPKGECDHA